ncbi:MAG: PepSY-associated TM helix domain-containing protein [Pseudomonadota bacterium]|nr:PepSY-associated TM helix domain-containing protein [Pseudomonadota bacterium]
MNLRPSRALVRRALSAHSGVGLAIGALMYLLCLTGALVVFFEEFERWEQPAVAEDASYSIAQLDAAAANFLAAVPQVPETVYLVLPSESMPRLHVAAGDAEWFVAADGRLAGTLAAAWTGLLQALHVHLHLPYVPGLILVGVLGVMLCSLIVSGLLAHPALIRDAFRWRRGGQGALGEVDLHNRLSVWGLPFHLMIAVTGAFLGLVSVFYAGAAYVYEAGDREAVLAQMYGADARVASPADAPFDIGRALDNLAEVAPAAEPMYVALQQPGQPGQHLEIAASLPQRLVYSEIYRFSPAGDYLGDQALASGPVGRQLAYSVYRLHFGHFAGMPVKLLYGLMGLALTVVSASGVNIYLAKRRRRGLANDLWVAVVWGSPLALALAALAALAGLPPLPAFLATGLVAALGAALVRDVDRTRRGLQLALGAGLLAVVAVHALRFGLGAGPAVADAINLTLLSAALTLLALSARRLWRDRLSPVTAGA